MGLKTFERVAASLVWDDGKIENEEDRAQVQEYVAERESSHASWMLSLLTICQVWPLLGTLAIGEGKAEDATWLVRSLRCS